MPYPPSEALQGRDRLIDQLNWRQGSVSEGHTLQMLRQQLQDGPRAIEHVCYATRTGNCLHTRRCGTIDIARARVYIYHDSTDLRALCAATGLQVCMNCARFDSSINVLSQVHFHVGLGCGDLYLFTCTQGCGSMASCLARIAKACVLMLSCK